MALLNDVAVDLPDSGPTLNESFRTHVDGCSLTRAGSGDSIPFVDAPQPMRKRSANDALGEEGGVGACGKFNTIIIDDMDKIKLYTWYFTPIRRFQIISTELRPNISNGKDDLCQSLTYNFFLIPLRPH
jgi:hypothetical protein